MEQFCIGLLLFMIQPESEGKEYVAAHLYQMRGCDALKMLTADEIQHLISNLLWSNLSS